MQTAINENKILINIYLVFLSPLVDNLQAKKTETPSQPIKITIKIILSNLMLYSFKLIFDNINISNIPYSMYNKSL